MGLACRHVGARRPAMYGVLSSLGLPELVLSPWPAAAAAAGTGITAAVPVGPLWHRRQSYLCRCPAGVNVPPRAPEKRARALLRRQRPGHVVELRASSAHSTAGPRGAGAGETR